jgi:membrane fusion protein (multidrug efflux system)
MKPAIKYVIIALIFVALLGLIAFFALKGEDAGEVQEAPPEVPVNVIIKELTTGPLPDAVQLPAKVEPYKSVRISTEVPGKVEWLGVEEGQTVDDGSPLARIDTRILKAELDRAQSAFDLASADFARVEKLLAQKAASRDEYDTFQSRMEVARAVLQQASVRFEQGSITAPCSGVLNRRWVELGEYVNIGDPIADVVRIDRVKIVVDIPEKDVRYIEIGAPMAILSETLTGCGDIAALGGQVVEMVERSLPDGYGLRIGTVTYRSVTADPATLTYRTEITMPNADGELLPGMIVKAVLLRRIIPDAVAVPLFAVVPRESRIVVFVEEDGRAREREVKIGVSDGERIQVTRGLEAGERLIVVGQRQITNGQAVSVQSVEGASE